MTIYIASDHAGYNLKQAIVSHYPEFVNLGTDSTQSVDYPFYAEKCAMALQHEPNSFGILLCGSGVGVSIKANRFAWVRAALCHTAEMAQLARDHNNANILCLGARFMTTDHAIAMIDIFIKTPFTDRDRHWRRVHNL